MLDRTYMMNLTDGYIDSDFVISSVCTEIFCGTATPHDAIHRVGTGNIVKRQRLYLQGGKSSKVVERIYKTMAAVLTRIVVLASRHCPGETGLVSRAMTPLYQVFAVSRVGATGGCCEGYLQRLLTAVECLADAPSPL